MQLTGVRTSRNPDLYEELDRQACSFEETLLRYLSVGILIGSDSYVPREGETLAKVSGVTKVPILVVSAKRVYLLNLGLVFLSGGDMNIVRSGGELFCRVASWSFRLKPLSVSAAMLVHANSLAEEVARAVGDPMLPTVFERSREASEQFTTSIRIRSALMGFRRPGDVVRTAIHATEGGLTVGAVYYDLGVDRWSYYRLNDAYTMKPETLEVLARAFRVGADDVEAIFGRVVEFLRSFPELLAMSYVAAELSKAVE